MRQMIIVAVCLALAGCGAAESFTEISPDIQAATASGPNLVVIARQSLVADSLAMTQLGTLIKDIAQGVQEGVPGPTETTQFVQLQLGYASTDHLGNEGTLDFGTIRLPIENLKAAKLENLVGEQFLELADRVSPSAGIDTAIQFCADSDNFSANPRWCEAVANGLGVG